MEKIDLQKILDFFNFWKGYTQPTEFYNEGWLTRLLIISITEAGLKDNDLFINEYDKYFSEPLLYSPFLSRFERDPLAESHTHVDSAIGLFDIGQGNSKGALKLTGNRLKLIEAKINSKFSPGVTNAKFYNQAARYIACICKTVENSSFLNDVQSLDLQFILLLPEHKFREDKSFAEMLDKMNIENVVTKRVEQYENEIDYANRQKWLKETFKKIIEKINIKHIYYEDIISSLVNYRFYKELKEYYKLCLKYN